MRVETNQHLVARNRKIATYLFIFSLIVLIVGFFAANGQFFRSGDEFNSDLYMLVMPVVLVVGMTSTLISVRMTNLWIRQPRPENAIREGLKGISNKSVLYNYLHFPARHVLICPQGVFAIITRFQNGRYTVRGERWITHMSLFSRMFSVFRLDGIGQPAEEARRAASHIQEVIDEFAPEIKVRPLIVFVDPRVQINIEDSTVPVLHADSRLKPCLKDYLKDYPKPQGGKSPIDIIEKFEEATIEFD